MEFSEDSSAKTGSINYDDTPIVQTQTELGDYRIDTGHGSAVAISRQEPGTWDWTLVSEGKWDGSRLKAKGLDYPVLTVLAQALSAAMRDREAGLD